MGFLAGKNVRHQIASQVNITAPCSLDIIPATRDMCLYWHIFSFRSFSSSLLTVQMPQRNMQSPFEALCWYKYFYHYKSSANIDCFSQIRFRCQLSLNSSLLTVQMPQRNMQSRFEALCWYRYFYHYKSSANIDFFSQIRFRCQLSLNSLTYVTTEKLFWSFTQNAVNTSGPRQNGRHSIDDIFECVFLSENV